jgi:large subunit ribosomal protein L23
MEFIRKPVITEKSTKLGDKLNQFVFRVDVKANKIQIKKAIESLYGVSIVSVNTMIYPGKHKSRYTKNGMVQGKTSRFKKAVITLKDGDTIDFYSNV